MWSLLRTRRWLSFTLTAIVAIIAFGLLSQWQWHRAHEEDAKAAEVSSGTDRAAVPIQEILEPGAVLASGAEWRQVTTSGVLNCDAGFLVRNKPLAATNGFWAACPLATDGGVLLWVNRGWFAAPGPATTTVAMPPSPTGKVEITGRLRPSQDGPAVPPSDLPEGQVSHLDTDVLTAAAGLAGPQYDPYLEVTAMTPPDTGDLKQLPVPTSDSAQNYSYAGQWLLFAAIAIGGWFYFLRREAQEDAAASDAAPSQQHQPTR